MQPSAHDIPALVDRWVAAGIISAEQADRIRRDYATLVPRRPVSLVAEGLGYLGGVIVVVGLALVLSLSWDRLSGAGRVGIAGGVAAALLVAGALIPTNRLGSTGPRLRGVLWIGASLAVAVGLGLTADQLVGWHQSDQVLLLSGAGAAVVSAVLWAFNRHVLQHLSTVVFVALAAGNGTSVANGSSFLSSLAVWGVGVVWFTLSLPNVIPARGGGILGALTAVVGSLMMIASDWGPLIALATVLALVLTAVMRREVPLLAISSIGTLIVLPFVVRRYLPGGVLSTAIALVIAGMALVVTGVYTARRRHTVTPG
ncbi:MAG TPA: DUF2157 domain-containing protein [Micromonosporaceae bacterium]|jgi:hypothetical protein